MTEDYDFAKEMSLATQKKVLKLRKNDVEEVARDVETHRLWLKKALPYIHLETHMHDLREIRKAIVSMNRALYKLIMRIKALKTERYNFVRMKNGQ